MRSRFAQHPRCPPPATSPPSKPRGCPPIRHPNPQPPPPRETTAIRCKSCSTVSPDPPLTPQPHKRPFRRSHPPLSRRMAITLTSLTDLAAHGFDDIIDVRAPAEYAEDHLPGAISLPVLDDAERAKVGTIYKQVSPFTARKIGAALVAANASRHLQGPLADKPGGWRPVVYCWRGGQRSGSFASILSQIGWRVELIAGGYKAWRA